MCVGEKASDRERGRGGGVNEDIKRIETPPSSFNKSYFYLISKIDFECRLAFYTYGVVKATHPFAFDCMISMVNIMQGLDSGTDIQGTSSSITYRNIHMLHY